MVGDFTDGVHLPDGGRLLVAPAALVLPRLHHRQLRPARGGGAPAPHGARGRSGRRAADRRRPPQGRGHAGPRPTTTPAGVTAAFDLNLLARMNRELGRRLPPLRPSATARSGTRGSRGSRCTSRAARPRWSTWPARPSLFRAGETIHTESAYKWEPRAFDALAAIAGWQLVRTWSDDRAWFTAALHAGGVAGGAGGADRRGARGVAAACCRVASSRSNIEPAASLRTVAGYLQRCLGWGAAIRRLTATFTQRRCGSVIMSGRPFRSTRRANAAPTTRGGRRERARAGKRVRRDPGGLQETPKTGARMVHHRR